jgi:hypothetical protein
MDINLKTGFEGVGWMQNNDWWLAVVKMALNISVP